MNPQEFRIDEEKFKEVLRLVQEFLDWPTCFEVESFVLADWREGQEHQEWLDTAAPEEIADWAMAGLR